MTTKRPTLKAAHFPDTVCLMPTWISNGHWAGRRTLFVNGALATDQDSAMAAFGIKGFQPVKSLDDDLIARQLAPVNADYAWTVTVWSVDSPGTRKGTCRALKHTSGQIRFIQQAYLDVFGIEVGDTLYSKGMDHGPLSDGETLLIMPIDGPGHDFCYNAGTNSRRNQ